MPYGKLELFRICDISLDLVTKASQVKGNRSIGVSLFQGLNNILVFARGRYNLYKPLRNDANKVNYYVSDGI